MGCGLWPLDEQNKPCWVWVSWLEWPLLARAYRRGPVCDGWCPAGPTAFTCPRAKPGVNSLSEERVYTHIGTLLWLPLMVGDERTPPQTELQITLRM